MPSKRKYASTKRNHYLDGYYLSLGVFFVLYQILSSIFVHLPILIGFFYCYAFVLFNESEKDLQALDFRWYFVIFYFLLIDITHDFYLFCSIFSFELFYYFCVDYIRTNFKIGKLIPVIFVFCAYVLEFSVDAFLSYISNLPLKNFNLSYALDIGIESLLCYIFFKDKLK